MRAVPLFGCKGIWRGAQPERPQEITTAIASPGAADQHPDSQQCAATNSFASTESHATSCAWSIRKKCSPPQGRLPFLSTSKPHASGFLPFVEPRPELDEGVSSYTVPSEAFGVFLCTIFDEWMSQDIGKVRIQIFEETAATALGQEHALCIFKKTCGDAPVLEHNGDFFACDHFVDKEHLLGNMRETPLVDLIEGPSPESLRPNQMGCLTPLLSGM